MHSSVKGIVDDFRSPGAAASGRPPAPPISELPPLVATPLAGGLPALGDSTPLVSPGPVLHTDMPLLAPPPHPETFVPYDPS